MKRPSMTIDGRPVTAEQIQAEVGEASAAWMRDRRPRKPDTPKRVHRARSPEEKEAKALATATAKKRREDEREARELEKLLGRIGYLSRRSEREAQRMLRVRVSWKSNAQPTVSAVCPHKLYSRLHPEISERAPSVAKPSRIGADGLKNIVLRKTARGLGRKASGTREYRPGEAADLARYIVREDALELDIQSCFTNILDISGEYALLESDALSIDNQRCAQIVAFWNALEAFEQEADADGNIYSHLILAMPHELSPEGRSRALEDFCYRLDALSLPYVAGLHRPDGQGDARNFHAHILLASRPFSIEGPFAWSFEAGKATELNLPAGLRWLRSQAADAFNHALKEEKLDLRYSGLSQAARNVPATDESHDGPAKTARKRRDMQDQAEREHLLGQLAHHVVVAHERQTDLVSRLAKASRPLSREPVVAPTLPPALAAVRAKYPDPLKLKGLSISDLMDFTLADEAADCWYGPALSLRADLQAYEGTRFVIDRGGQPELNIDALDERSRILAQAPALPDIVQEMLVDAHRRLVPDTERRKAREREEEQLRKKRIAWLHVAPIRIFDERARVLPVYRHLFPRAVMEMPGVKQAMMDCHFAAMKLELDEARRGHQAETDPHVKVAIPSLPQPAERSDPPRVDLGSKPVSDKVENEEDAEWDMLRQAYQSGLARPPGAGRE